jgi:hypothetical protein
MTATLSPSEQLSFSTARIECETAQGISTGTGFFFQFLDDGNTHVPAFVTNRHVIKGALRGKFHLTLADESGAPLTGKHLGLILENFESRWIGHPDPSVDLCIMPIAPLLQEAAQSGHRFFYIPLNNGLIPTADEMAGLTAMEDVIMIGYPNGIWDSVNNMPIIRRGVTATHPALDYEGRKEFMVDAACFPGSSGSPVFLYNVGGWAMKGGGMAVGTRIKLLGALYAGPQHTATGEIQIVNVPTQQTPVAISRIPNNLGLIIKSSRLVEFDDVIRKLAGAPDV